MRDMDENPLVLPYKYAYAIAVSLKREMKHEMKQMPAALKLITESLSYVGQQNFKILEEELSEYLVLTKNVEHYEVQVITKSQERQVQLNSDKAKKKYSFFDLDQSEKEIKFVTNNRLIEENLSFRKTIIRNMALDMENPMGKPKLNPI